MKWLARIFALGTTCLAALQTAPVQAAGWTPPLTIISAFVEDSDVIAVYTSNGTQFTPGCQVNAWIVSWANEDRKARAWATILTAMTTGRKVRFWYPDNCTLWTYHQATAVMVDAN